MATLQDLDDQATSLLEHVDRMLRGSTYDKWLLVAILAKAQGAPEVLRMATDAMAEIERINREIDRLPVPGTDTSP